MHASVLLDRLLELFTQHQLIHRSDVFAPSQGQVPIALRRRRAIGLTTHQHGKLQALLSLK